MKLDAEIIINAPPRVVRETFLNFPELRNWHDGSFWKVTEVLAPGKKTGLETVKGDQVKCTMPSMSFKTRIDVNEPNLFRGASSIPMMGSAAHSYYFTSVPENANQTKFIQHEDITGLTSVILGLMGAGKDSEVGWKKVNEDLKIASEKAWNSQQLH